MHLQHLPFAYPFIEKKRILIQYPSVSYNNAEYDFFQTKPKICIYIYVYKQYAALYVVKYKLYVVKYKVLFS